MLSLAATAAALTLTPMAPPLRPLCHVQRVRTVTAQSGWIAAVDEESGHTYYYNEQTGQSQWEFPQQSYARVLWRVVPGHWDEPPSNQWGMGKTRSTGVKSEYTICNGEEQVLGRFDMFEEDPYVSREQLTIKVDDDGNAHLFSIGKPPTALRGHRIGALWYGIKKGEHVSLADGEHISLDCKNPEAAFFTISREETADAAGCDVQYSDDGEWLWDGREWLPARRSR